MWQLRQLHKLRTVIKVLYGCFCDTYPVTNSTKNKKHQVGTERTTFFWPTSAQLNLPTETLRVEKSSLCTTFGL